MKVDRTKLITIENNVQERFINDEEYAEILFTKIIMLGGIKPQRIHPFSESIGYAVLPKDRLRYSTTGSDPFSDYGWRFLMGKHTIHSMWQIHPSRVNWFLNGGWNAGPNKT